MTLGDATFEARLWRAALVALAIELLAATAVLTLLVTR